MASFEPVSTSSFTIHPLSAEQRLIAAWTSPVTSKLLKPRPVPTSAVADADAANGGWLFHLTLASSHGARMRCAPWVRVWFPAFTSA